MVDGALGDVHPAGLASCLHVVGKGHVVAPHVILPLAQPEHSTQHAAAVDPHPHIDVDPGDFSDKSDGFDHVDPKLHAALGVVIARLGNAANAVVAVA